MKLFLNTLLIAFSLLSSGCGNKDAAETATNEPTTTQKEAAKSTIPMPFEGQKQALDKAKSVESGLDAAAEIQRKEMEAQTK